MTTRRGGGAGAETLARSLPLCRRKKNKISRFSMSKHGDSMCVEEGRGSREAGAGQGTGDGGGGGDWTEESSKTGYLQNPTNPAT